MRLPLTALLLCLAGAAQAGQIALYIWSDYLAPGVLEDFAAETAVAVRADAYPTSETAEARLLAGGSGYDVAVVASDALGRLIAAGAVAPLDRARLPNLANLDPAVMARLDALDPGGRHSAPYLWGTTGLAFDAAKIAARAPDAPTESWAMVFDPAWAARFADCGIGIVDEPEEVLSAALLWLGRDPRSTDARDVAEALAAIAAIAPHVTRFDSEQVGDLAEGRLCLAVGWSSDVLTADAVAAEGVDLRYVIPREGAHLWVDLFVIPADAPDPENAHRLIDFMLRGDIAARSADSQFGPNANLASVPFLDPAIANDPAVRPPPETVARLHGLADRDAGSKRAIARAWTRIKLGLPPE
jgi:putrescine transport system substrate-binding protein